MDAVQGVGRSLEKDIRRQYVQNVWKNNMNIIIGKIKHQKKA